MTRTAYKNQYVRDHYDRINLCIPKGEKAKIKAVADDMRVSVNEYLFMLIYSDYGSNKRQAQEFSEEHRKLLDKWQVAQKYRDMIESMDVDEINGMNKHYTIVLKSGYTNDETGSRYIKADKMQDLRRMIKKSHRTNER